MSRWTTLPVGTIRPLPRREGAIAARGSGERPSGLRPLPGHAETWARQPRCQAKSLCPTAPAGRREPVKNRGASFTRAVPPARAQPALPPARGGPTAARVPGALPPPGWGRPNIRRRPAGPARPRVASRTRPGWHFLTNRCCPDPTAPRQGPFHGAGAHPGPNPRSVRARARPGALGGADPAPGDRAAVPGEIVLRRVPPCPANPLPPGGGRRKGRFKARPSPNHPPSSRADGCTRPCRKAPARRARVRTRARDALEKLRARAILAER